MGDAGPGYPPPLPPSPSPPPALTPSTSLSSPSSWTSHQQNPQPVRSGLPSANPTPSFWQTSFPNDLAHHRSTTELPAHADVVVVGTGISGTFAVDELLNNAKASAESAAAAAATEMDVNHDGLTSVLVLEARTLCSAATGRNGGHLQPVIHNAPAHIIDFELRNFHHVEALALKASTKSKDDNHHHHHTSGGNDSYNDETTPSSTSSWCDFRRLEGCLGFWNKEYFRDAKRDLAAAAAAAAAAANAGSGTDGGKNMPAEDYAGLARVVEDSEELEALGLRVDSGAVGAIVQSVAASLSPYKLCVGMWKDLLERFEQQEGEVDPAAGPWDGRGTTKDSQGTEKQGRAISRPNLNLQTETPVTALERAEGGNGWILHTPRGSVRARTAILATNAYTSHLLPEFAPLIRPVQAQMSALVPPPARNDGARRSGQLIPMSYGFMGVGDMDRVMSDYLVQNPYVSRRHRHHYPHRDRHGVHQDVEAGAGADAQAEPGEKLLADEEGGVVAVAGASSSTSNGGGHLMFGGGRHLASNHGEGIWDDDFVDANVERYLRSLPERLNLEVNLDLVPNLDHNQTDEMVTTKTKTTTTTTVTTHDGNEAGTSPSPPPLAIAGSWTGIIGHSADGHPWVGRAPLPGHAATKNLFVCAGYTGHGMTNAPLCGREVARRALREHLGVPVCAVAVGVQDEEKEVVDGGGSTDVGMDTETYRNRNKSRNMNRNRNRNADRDLDMDKDMDGDADLDMDMHIPREYLITRERIERVLQGSSI